MKKFNKSANLKLKRKSPIEGTDAFVLIEEPEEEEEFDFTPADSRNIYITHEVGEELLEYVSSIIAWNKEDQGLDPKEREPINVFIDTPGGNLDHATTFVEVINMSKTPIKVIALGMAWSAGSYILATAPKGCRYVLPSTSVMIHDGYVESRFPIAKFKTELDKLDRDYRFMVERFLKNTNISREMLKQKAKETWYLDAEEAVRFGIADEVLSDLEALF